METSKKNKKNSEEHAKEDNIQEDNKEEVAIKAEEVEQEEVKIINPPPAIHTESNPEIA